MGGGAIMSSKAWFLGSDGTCPSTLYVMYDRKKSPIRELDFRLAKPIDEDKVKCVYFYVEPTPKATLENILKWDFLPNSTRLLLVNDKALALLEEIAHGEFQAIQAHIIMPDGLVIKDYKLVNLLNALPILNHEKSVLEEERFRRDWNKYSYHYYNRDALGACNLAGDNYTTWYFGSDKLRKAVKAAKLRGLTFREDIGVEHQFLKEDK